VCSYYRHAWLTRNVVAFVEAAAMPVMWTLTLRTGSRSSVESFGEIKAAWVKLRKRMGRRFRDRPFVWVVETTEAGYAHLHVIIDGYWDWGFVSRAWHEVTGDSMVVRFDRIRSAGGAGRYIAKYVGKEVRGRRLSGHDVRSYHLFGKSAGVHFDSFTHEGEGWTVLEQSWRDNAAWLRQNAVVVSDSRWGTGRIVVKAAGRTPVLRKWEEAPLQGFEEHMGGAKEPPWVRHEPPPVPDMERTCPQWLIDMVEGINSERREENARHKAQAKKQSDLMKQKLPAWVPTGWEGVRE
jgi:hypothetical protein